MAAYTNLDQPENGRLKGELLCNQVKLLKGHRVAFTQVELVLALLKKKMRTAWDSIELGAISLGDLSQPVDCFCHIPWNICSSLKVR